MTLIMHDQKKISDLFFLSKQQLNGLLDKLLEALQKLGPNRSVDNAMVSRQCDTHNL